MPCKHSDGGSYKKATSYNTLFRKMENYIGGLQCSISNSRVLRILTDVVGYRACKVLTPTAKILAHSGLHELIYILNS